MNSSSDPILENFIRLFLHAGGAVTEVDAGGIQALLPETLAKTLAVPEMVRFTTDPNFTFHNPDPERLPVTYGSPILEKMLSNACAETPVTACRVHFHYLKSSGFHRLIRERFDIQGAIITVESQAEVQTEYLHLAFVYVVQSDEQKEGLVHATVNLESGAEAPGFEEGLAAVEKEFQGPGAGFPWDARQVEDLRSWAERRAQTLVNDAIRPFQERMNRRFQRDVKSLEAYYAALFEEMESGLNRSGLSDQLIRDRKEKMALLPEELSRKKEDLFKKYSIRVRLRLCGGVRVRTPAVKLLVRFDAGKKRKTYPFVYNPVTRTLDPVVCRECRASTYHIHVFRDLKVLCPDCAASYSFDSRKA